MRLEQRLERVNPSDIISKDEFLMGVLGLEESSFRFGLKVKIFNAEMRFRREDLGLTQKLLGKRVLDRLNSEGIPTKAKNLSGTMSQIEGFYRFPTGDQAKIIADILGTDKETLFPEWLKFYVLDKGRGTKSLEISSSQGMLEAALEIDTSTLLFPAAEVELEDQAFLDILKENIPEITKDFPREEISVLNLYFGLIDRGEGMTIPEIATKLNIPVMEARRNLTRALVKFNNPIVRWRLGGFF